jgi:hypothetical protein
MKKVFLLFVFLSQTNSFSQLNYPDSKQYLKEFIAIQTLLAENRLDDLKSFLIEYNWYPLPELDEFTFCRVESNLSENDVYPFIRIDSRAEKGYSDKSLLIYFVKFKPSNFKMSVSLEEGHRIQYLIKHLYELGFTYPLLESMNGNNETTVEKIDRFTYKVSPINIKNESYIYKVSNFIPGKLFDLKNYDIYYGPGKIKGTLLAYDDLIKFESEGVDNYVVRMHLSSILPDTKHDKFDINEFMNLKEFNDRIWLDDK